MTFWPFKVRLVIEGKILVQVVYVFLIYLDGKVFDVNVKSLLNGYSLACLYRKETFEKENL